MEKISGIPNWVPNWSFCYFLKIASLVFLDIAAWGKPEKKIVEQIRAEMIFSILMSSSVNSNLLVFTNSSLEILVLIPIVFPSLLNRVPRVSKCPSTLSA